MLPFPGDGSKYPPEDLLEVLVDNVPDIQADICSNAITNTGPLEGFKIDFQLKMDIPIDINSPYTFTLRAEARKHLLAYRPDRHLC